MPEDELGPYFAMVFEVGIINQIGTAFLEARLPKGFLASHFGVVSHLIRVTDGATPLELANAFQVAKTTMTHTLSGLEKHGFVEMRPNPEDKRSKQVWLTDAGRDFQKDSLAKMIPIFRALSERFPPERVAEMLPDLTNYRKIVDELRDEMT